MTTFNNLPGQIRKKPSVMLLTLCLLLSAGLTGRAAVPGSIVGWGWNAYGQATGPAGLSNVMAIAAGSSHTVAVKSDGTVAV